MRNFIQKALNKLQKLDKEQIRILLVDLASENELLEIVLDSLDDGVLVVDLQSKLITYNRMAEKLICFKVNDPTDRVIWEVVEDQDIAEFIERVLKNAERVNEEEFSLNYSGIVRTICLDAMPVVKKGSIQGTAIIVSDITERKKKEAQLRRAESLASLTTLAAGVAHEIKNPLGSIGIHIQLMQKSLKRDKVITEEKAGKYLGIINEEIERLNEIIVDFLFAVRPMNTNLEVSHINTVVSDLLNFVKFELKNNGIIIKTDLDLNIPKINMDVKFMKQALLNIIKNAEAAMPHGGELTIKTYESDGNVVLDVQDTGFGISEENIGKIFEPYFTTKQFGSGLGLTVVYKIIKEHGGEIFLESKEGKGTTFTIKIPVPQKEKKLIEWQDENEV